MCMYIYILTYLLHGAESFLSSVYIYIGKMKFSGILSGYCHIKGSNWVQN